MRTLCISVLFYNVLQMSEIGPGDSKQHPRLYLMENLTHPQDKYLQNLTVLTKKVPVELINELNN